MTQRNLVHGMYAMPSDITENEGGNLQIVPSFVYMYTKH